MRREGLRGQAWVVFTDITSASSALRSLQDFPFFGRPLKLQYAITKSDAAAKADGTWKMDLRTRSQKIAAPLAAGGGGQRPSSTHDAHGYCDDIGQPNKTLFIEDLPEATTEAMLSLLFQQFSGYQETRMVAGRPGIAFVDFDSDGQAGVAMSGLQGFKVTPTNTMKLTYAKQ
jgi:U2 small nuclear ribonucleoprotein B''